MESATHRRIHQRVASLRPRRLLEVGTGPGVLLARVADALPSARLVGLDRSAAMLRRARLRLGTGRAALLRADAAALPVSPATFDVVVCCYVLDLLPTPTLQPVLTELRRVLRSDGRALVAVMRPGSRVFNAVWATVYRLAPLLVGNCRPVDLGEPVARAGLETLEIEEPGPGLPTRLYILRPRSITAGDGGPGRSEEKN